MMCEWYGALNLDSRETHHKPPRNAKAPTPRQKGEGLRLRGTYAESADTCARTFSMFVKCFTPSAVVKPTLTTP